MKSKNSIAYNIKYFWQDFLACWMKEKHDQILVLAKKNFFNLKKKRCRLTDVSFVNMYREKRDGKLFFFEQYFGFVRICLDEQLQLAEKDYFTNHECCTL